MRQAEEAAARRPPKQQQQQAEAGAQRQPGGTRRTASDGGSTSSRRQSTPEPRGTAAAATAVTDGRRRRRRLRRRRAAAVHPAGVVTGRTAINAALSQLGVPYRYAASSPGRSLRLLGPHEVGVGLRPACPCRTTRVPRRRRMPHVPASTAQPGDLIFYYSPISHVGIYLGGGQLVHAPNTGDVVNIASGQLGQGHRRRPTRLTVPSAAGLCYGFMTCRPPPVLRRAVEPVSPQSS